MNFNSYFFMMNLFIRTSWCSGNVFVWPFPIAASRKSETSNSWRHISACCRHIRQNLFCIFHCLAARSVCAMQRTCISCCILFFILCISPVCIFVFLLVQCVHQTRLLFSMVFFLSYVWIISKLADRNSAGFLQTKPFHQCTWAESIKGSFFSQE